MWYNQNAVNGNIFFIRDWYEKGIKFVSDIIDDEGNLYNFEALKAKYNLRGTILDFRAFIRRLQELWKNLINDNRITCMLTKFDVRCNVYLQVLLRDKKGCRRLYDVMVPTKLMQSNKWEQ